MRTKLRLSHTEQREYTLYAKRLSAVGIIPSEEKLLREAQMLSLERTGGVHDNFVHVPPTGGYGIVVRVRIVALKSGINLSGCEIKPCKWHDADIELMEAPEDLDYYQVIGGFECPKEDVLNPWISSTRSLGFGQVLQGAIVARSFGSLPKWCDNGISIEADLCFFDQFENLCPLRVDLRVIRDTERRERQVRRTGLYGPAMSASEHGGHVDKPDLSGRDDILRRESNVPRPNGGVH